MTANDLYARAFNSGSDARLAGLHHSANPHGYPAKGSVSWFWRHGWLDVDRFFASQAIYPVRHKLPEVEAAR